MDILSYLGETDWTGIVAVFWLGITGLAILKTVYTGDSDMFQSVATAMIPTATIVLKHYMDSKEKQRLEKLRAENK